MQSFKSGNISVHLKSRIVCLNDWRSARRAPSGGDATPKRITSRELAKSFCQSNASRYSFRMPRPINLTLAFGLLVSMGACTTMHTGTVKNTSRTFTTVVVDAGHGGKDSGAYRRSGPPEKVVALDVAQRLERKLRESQLKTVMTRSSDTFIPLDERVAIENSQKNAIFVSIHFNDSRKRGIRGVDTYYHSAAASELANRIQAKLITIPHSGNRGVHTANFRVLRLASYPAVLVECGFLSNRSDGKQARDWEYRELLADRIAEAIVELRYGVGVYRPSGRLAAQLQPASTGPAPGSGTH
jgi:N-acetylmuramoyl-L-alanine amidase